MPIELRHLRYFVAVAQEGNVTRAAARLHISQPPLSQQIKELEQMLGVTLFQRTPQGMALTAPGQVFLNEAQRTLQAAEQAQQAAVRAAQGRTGTLRVGFTSSAAFNPVVAGTLRAFRQRWPDVQLILEETNSTHLTEALLQRTLDAAFLRPGQALPPGLRVHRFADEPMQVVLPASHPLARRKRVALQQLAHEPFVLFPRAVGLSLYDAVVGACQAAGFEPQRGVETTQLSSVINLVAAGMGVSVVPASLTQIQVAGVRYVGIQGRAPRATLGLAVHRTHPTPTVDNLMQIAQAGPRLWDTGCQP